ncbi:DUF2931 family protein [Luteimonas sp. FCS-9]|uniref:DUF2931 family protein n=1 Tax=Luteimonas sp. FCS-9 TaxID=1547516 RepID=UPI0009E1E900|nr:DUF2931 family protein [Luteimonas sp. FCS-9]
MKRIGIGALLALLLAACASGAANARLPYEAWRLGFLAPHYMEVWTEDAAIEDVRGRVFSGYRSGTVAVAHSGDAAGWPVTQSMGKGRYVVGADLPRRIHVRWQSLVEPQTYRITLDIPDEMRALMLEKANSIAVPGRQEYRNAVVVGLAPGGWVKVWVKSPGSERIEALCQKAEVEPKGPDQGAHGGRYVTLPPKVKAYIDQNPVPYDSWKCPENA